MNSKALLIKRYIFLLLAVVCMVFIFRNSNEPAPKSAQKSEGMADVVTPIVVPDYETHSEPVKIKEKQKVERTLRELAHAAEFAALGVFSVGFAMTFDINKKKIPNMLFGGLAAFGFCVIYAVSDEVHQLFVDGRAFEVADIITDAVGAAAGILIFTLIVWAIDKLINKRKNKNAG